MLATPAWATTEILVLGDSLTEGYGLTKEQAFPAVLEKLIAQSGKKDVVVLNGGVSGSTTASGASRLKWHLKAQPEIVIIALGANDGLRGVKIEESRKNLTATIELARKSGLKVLLAGMKLPPNYGKEYSRDFEKMFVELSKKYSVPLIPFLLEGVGGDPSLNLEDGIHPNAQGHEKIAKTVLKHLKGLL